MNLALKHITSVVFDSCLSLSLGLTQDVFYYASLLQKKYLGEGFEIFLASVDGEDVSSFSGMAIQVQGGLKDIGQTDLVILHACWGDIDVMLEKNQGILKQLRQWHKQGIPILAPTTASYFLAQAGLLDGRLCTTHWHKHQDFIQRYPKAQCKPERFITATDGLYCSAGMNAGMEVMVYVLSRLTDKRIAQAVEHTFLVDFRRAYQHEFIQLADQSHHQDDGILSIQQWLEINFSDDFSLQYLADKSHMSLRSFKRRFKEATGESPLLYIQKLRIEQGKEYLKHSNKSVGQIAWDVGYEDAGHFNRLFKRHNGITPAKWRKQQGLTLGLAGGADKL